jgi:small subunit ribosomal protein S21
MTQVVLGENENIESALRRFKREVSKAGIFQDMRKKRHFETPIEKEKRKAIARHKQNRRSNTSKVIYPSTLSGKPPIIRQR